MTDPEVLLFDASDREEEAAADLADKLRSFGIASPFVVSSVHGEVYAAQLNSEPVGVIAGADQDWAMAAGSKAQKAGADAVIAIGGGRVLDLGKLAAARAGLTLIAVPTQLSHDGICSPVAVVPDDEGRSQSLGANEPKMVFLSLPTLMRAPVRSSAAGMGDLLANPLALRDWALASTKGLETIDQGAWDLSVESFELVEPYLDTSVSELVGDAAFVRLLAHALILSGLSMIRSGTSRPASGAEHEISHAIDHLFGGRALHGEQVAFGSIFSVALYGEDVGAFRARLDRLGLPSHPSQLQLAPDELVRVLLEAPETRPGRFTVIEEAALDEASATALIDRIWPA